MTSLRPYNQLTPQQTDGLTAFLGQYITEARREMIDQVLSMRTRHFTLVLEDIYQSQNASAVVRTCECMGIQDLHIVESRSQYSVNRKVLMGANKWMNLIRYKDKTASNIEQCYSSLRNSGYRILVTHPESGISIDDVDINSKVAVVMGNELKGISDWTLKNADERIHIPMYGFTESMNISVSAAICIRTMMARIRQSDVAWQLSESEIKEIRLEWFRKCVKNPGIMEKVFFETHAGL